ncbi:MAG: ABC transporter ATP-binding protein [Oscillospiraceae bacterium]|nr:ABC transporter ATP-binding protein [Oscillospiraceae bacterium]
MADILKIEDLRIHFKDAKADRFAVDGLSFSIGEGEIVGLVGESGSGKTVTAMSVSGLLPREKADVSGSITLEGREIFRCTDRQILEILGDDLGIVFQEPMTSMNPVMRIGPQVEECLRLHTKLSKAERKQRALEAMAQVDLPDPERIYRKYPHELSGGMLQRVMIAAAIISKPRLLLADEPTTALDVTIQAEILELLKKLNREHGTAILLISHNLHVVRKLCTRVVVMQRGKLVEDRPVDDIFRDPRHEYTKKLLAAIPTRDRKLI